jgi:hypothetical protein
LQFNRIDAEMPALSGTEVDRAQTTGRDQTSNGALVDLSAGCRLCLSQE